MDDLTERQAATRRELVQALRDDILGPAGGPEEVLTGSERPLTRYLVGRLAPVGTGVDAEEDDDSAGGESEIGDSDAGTASPVTMAMNPSSIGLSFVVDDGVDELEITATWGRYVRETATEAGDGGSTEEGAGSAGLPDDGEGGEPRDEAGDGGAGEGADTSRRPRGKRRPTRWRRRHHVLTCRLRPADGRHTVAQEDGASVEAVVRQTSDGLVAVSVFLVNRIRPAKPDHPDDGDWMFQPTLEARAPDGAAVFRARRPDETRLAGDREMQSNELLYLDRPEFAVGHGCAAAWDDPPGPATGPTTRVATEFVPSYEVPRVDPRESDDPGLDMRALGGSGPGGVPGPRLQELLTPLADGYAAWLEELRRTRLPALPEHLREVAADHLDACEIVLDRIRAGIDAVVGDPELRAAFCFANRAMALQRERTVRALAARRGESPGPVVARWRPFQLAFILLNIPALADRRHADRDIADLLWFPTGGGKTEAYLGLTAFALAHRRLRQPLPGYRSDAGVAVLMRYTLRLLTIQQFQRATALICACEQLRRDEGEWGETPFSIGLWVGLSGTPNRFDDAKEALDALANGRRPSRGTPVQLLYCPWCGHDLPENAWQADPRQRRIIVTCPNDECEFGPVRSRDGLPVHTVDEQVYRHVPSLVIATVDKFAQMPFNGRTKTLFGRVSRWCERHGFLTNVDDHPKSHRAEPGWPATTVEDSDPLEPPDLIIQDELHLISGPLGTLVGLYETAVDTLASAPDGGTHRPPKVVASTATIRRAREQVGALFNRRICIFPPSALDASSSWFGQETPVDREPGRLFVGVFAPGKSVKTALLRVDAALLSRAARLHDDDPDATDPYMTLVGYFNSLRELGGAVRLAEDDIPSRIKLLHRRDRDTWAWRPLYERRELTSNRRAEEIPEILAMLERRFTRDRRRGRYPVDVLFASNMISVGVDIDRLGLMVVNGQPKTTAEYIQATSRVGRRSPGLVVTVYNWTRPRDISHYERFRSYHAALYRHVEATSVTPFSSRARDKGLAGVLTAMVRLGDDALTPGPAAAALDRSDERLGRVVDLLAARAAAVSNDHDVGVATKGEATRALDQWSDAALEHRDLVYSTRDLGGRPRNGRCYLLGAQESGEHVGVFTAPGSLREVESEVHVYLLGTSLGEVGNS